MAAWCEAHGNALNALCEQNVTAGCIVGAIVVVVIIIVIAVAAVFLKNLLCMSSICDNIQGVSKRALQL
jgi:hypothetical protein